MAFDISCTPSDLESKWVAPVFARSNAPLALTRLRSYTGRGPEACGLTSECSKSEPRFVSIRLATLFSLKPLARLVHIASQMLKDGAQTLVDLLLCLTSPQAPIPSARSIPRGKTFSNLEPETQTASATLRRCLLLDLSLSLEQCPSPPEPREPSIQGVGVAQERKTQEPLHLEKNQTTTILPSPSVAFRRLTSLTTCFSGPRSPRSGPAPRKSRIGPLNLLDTSQTQAVRLPPCRPAALPSGLLSRKWPSANSANFGEYLRHLFVCIL